MDCFGRTQQAKNKTEEAQAREKLELVLLDLQTDKAVDSTYNENVYIDNKIKENGMVVSGDIVFVDGYQFQIDRSVPKIGVSIGKGEEDSQIEITMTSATSSDFVKATIHIEIAYEKEIATIIFDGENLDIPQKQDGKYVIEKEVNKNSTYSVIAKNSEDKYNIASVMITDISEDMDIYTAEDLVAFRDKVNRGATFEGKTIRVMNNLDLKDVCGEGIASWEPIGNYETDTSHIFKGTFDGMYHTISNLYINSKEYQYIGFFSIIGDTSIIQNVIFNNIHIYSNYSDHTHYTGGIVGYNNGVIQRCGINNGTISSDSSSNAVYNEIGGMAGLAGTNAKILKCYNKASIKGFTKNEDMGYSYVGGIVGRCDNDGVEIIDCYNIGNLNVKGYQANAGGIIGFTSKTNQKDQTLKNLYNIGEITGEGKSPKLAGIVGYNGYNNDFKSTNIENSYCTNDCSYIFSGTKYTTGVVSKEKLKTYSNILGESYTNDEQNEDETWKYNNGYPILKWQSEIK